MERRSLAAAVTTIPNADPQAVRDFIVQEPRMGVTEPIRQRANLSSESFTSSAAIATNVRHRRTKSTGVTPVGLIPVTVRLRPELAGALKRASLERQLQGDELFTQQELVERALEPWLRSEGYLD